jgi:hypothetical protein
MIPATGSPRKEVGKSPDPAGNRWNMGAVFRSEIVRILSGGFLSTSCAFRQEPAGNHRKKIQKISGLNTASTKSPELPGTGSFRAGLFALGRFNRSWICLSFFLYSLKLFDYFVK